MFDTGDTHLTQIKDLAEGIVLAEARMDQLEKDIAADKERLIALMQQAGQTAVKLDSGLSPRLEVKQRISKHKDIPNEQMFDWLSDNGLGDIIKPAVHPGTLQTTLDSYLAAGHQLPETLFNQFEQTVVRFNGKTQFLQAHNH